MTGDNDADADATRDRTPESATCMHGVEARKCQVRCEECGHRCSDHCNLGAAAGPCTSVHDTGDDICACTEFQSSPG